MVEYSPPSSKRYKKKRPQMFGDEVNKCLGIRGREEGVFGYGRGLVC